MESAPDPYLKMCFFREAVQTIISDAVLSRTVCDIIQPFCLHQKLTEELTRQNLCGIIRKHLNKLPRNDFKGALYGFQLADT